jgi:Fic family protein
MLCPPRPGRRCAFVPSPLPPTPPLELTPLFPLLDRANQALGCLDGLSTLLPDTELFLYLYVRKEAVLASIHFFADR